MKYIYLVNGTSSESYADFSERILLLCKEVKERIRPASIWVTLTESPPPVLSVIPFKKKKIAAISLIMEEPVILDKLTDEPGFEGCYEATEAIPLSYTKNWNDGIITPGICLLTLFRKKEGISYETFLDRWHNSHTPLSLRLHPLWHYNRNVVSAVKVKGPVTWDGIVEEHFRSRSHLVNPFRFFGNPIVILPRMVAVYRDTRSFLDYGTIKPWLVREYHI